MKTNYIIIFRVYVCLKRLHLEIKIYSHSFTTEICILLELGKQLGTNRQDFCSHRIYIMGMYKDMIRNGDISYTLANSEKGIIAKILVTESVPKKKNL